MQSKYIEEKVRVVGEGLLEREFCVITGILYFNRWVELVDHYLTCVMAEQPGFRSSYAWPMKELPRVCQ